MANIKLKNAKGIEQTYNGVTTIKVKDTNNNLVSFSIGSTVYSITTTLTNVTGAINNPTIIAPNGTATLMFTTDLGYALPSSITVTGASYTWNDSTGILVLSNPTSNVSITISSSIIILDNILENNSWENIKIACESGNPILSTWLGQTKYSTYNGVATSFKLVDTYVGRYKFTDDNSDSHAVFEMVNTTSSTFTWGTTTVNGYADSNIKTLYDTNFYNLLANDLKNLLKNTTVYSVKGNSNSSTAYPATNCKIFPACATEMFNNWYTNETTGGQFEYYIGKANSYRIKSIPNSSTAVRYHLRSPVTSSTVVIGVSTSGELQQAYATESLYGSVCFAF